MDNTKIMKRIHRARAYGHSDSVSNSQEDAQISKRQNRNPPSPVICKIVPRLCPQQPQPQPPKTTSSTRSTPSPTPNRPTTPVPRPNPTPTPAPAPAPSPTTSSVVNPPPAPSNANPPPNTVSRASQGTQTPSRSISPSQTVSASGTSTARSSSASDSITSTKNPAPTPTDRGNSSNQSSTISDGTVPFGIDPSSTVTPGVNVDNNNSFGGTGIGTTSAAAGANAGPIIGGILGAVFLVLIILAGIVVVRQRRNRANRVAPSSEFMGGNKQYPFAGGIQPQQPQSPYPQMRLMGNSPTSAQGMYDIRRGA